MHGRTAEPNPYVSSLSIMQPQSQTNPSLLQLGSTQFHTAPHELEPRMLPTSTLLPPHFQPAQFASDPLHTHQNNFSGQYMMLMHPPPFQNPPSQLEFHPLESGSYPSPRYFPLALYPPYHQSNAGGSNLSHYLPPPMPQPVINNRAPYRAGVYDIQGYAQPMYSSTGYLGLPPQYQPNEYQTHYPHPLTQHLPRDSNTLWVQSNSLDHSSSSSLGTNSATAPQNTCPPTATHPIEKIPVTSQLNSETSELRDHLAATASRTHHQPLVRRQYHPNPPPNRSEWVMWVGNVPTDVTQDELWQLLGNSEPDAPDSDSCNGVGVLSVFLISRSKCAFVNYRSEQHLNRAISKFDGRQLRPHDRWSPRLVCRARRKGDDLRAGVGSQRGTGLHVEHVKKTLRKGEGPVVRKSESTSPEGRRSSDLSTITDPPPVRLASRDDETIESPQADSNFALTRSSSSYASTTSSLLVRHFPKRFFILKSLTQDDLDLSVERGAWATQKHNESILDQAFRTSKEVTLIFSANKSGEFYGYARMASAILRSNHTVTWTPLSDPSTLSPLPSSLPTYEKGEQSPQAYISPSEYQPVGGFPFPPMPLSDEGHIEHRSAPPSLYRNDEDRISPNPPSRLITSQVTYSPSTRRYEPGKSPEMRARTRNGYGVDELGNLGMQLQPVMEEIQGKIGVEEDIPASTTASESLEAHVDPNVGRRDANWGETFKIDWSCTKRVPFHRTRHLRNPWNHSREIKVSRDGTELEPTVGQQLVDEWLALASEEEVGDARRGRRAARPIARPRSARESQCGTEEPA